jgi:hypothetical protein
MTAQKVINNKKKQKKTKHTQELLQEMTAQKVVTLKQADVAQGNCLLGFAEIDVSSKPNCQ